MRTAQRAIRLLSKLTRRLIKQKARHNCRSSSDTLLAYGFRYYFTPLTAVLFTFPSRYLFTIGHWLVFSLTPWSALDSCEISRVSHYSGLSAMWTSMSATGLSPFIGHYSSCFAYIRPQLCRSYNPAGKPAVWAVPHSLAATNGITFVFCSIGY